MQTEGSPTTNQLGEAIDLGLTHRGLRPLSSKSLPTDRSPACRPPPTSVSERRPKTFLERASERQIEGSIIANSSRPYPRPSRTHEPPTTV
jgi:hypothetical protein